LRTAAAIVALLCALAAQAAAHAALTQAALDHFESRKSSMALANGLHLAYIDTGPRDAPVMVLIHGYTDSSRDWAPLAPLLEPRFRLIIVDLRGHGASDKPPCCYTRFDFAYDVKLLLEGLHIQQADVVGHSLGSLVAQTFAELWPGATRGLILISSTGTSFAPDDISRSWLAGVELLRDPIDPDSPFMRQWWQQSLLINPDFFSRRQRRDAAAIPAAVWRAIADQSIVGVDLRPMLPRIKARTLLIWGGQDTLPTPAGREALRSGIAGAKVRTFPALGHDLFWQEPSSVADAMLDFL
jgi:pimeloyl-ACP methyl ester carboxylesterase